MQEHSRYIYKCKLPQSNEGNLEMVFFTKNDGWNGTWTVSKIYLHSGWHKGCQQKKGEIFLLFKQHMSNK